MTFIQRAKLSDKEKKFRFKLICANPEAWLESSAKWDGVGWGGRGQDGSYKINRQDNPERQKVFIQEPTRRLMPEQI